MQAQTVWARFQEAERTWQRLLELLGESKLHERVGGALFDAALGLRVTRPTYVKLTGVDERTATRDLARATEAGLLQAMGERRGRYYVAGAPLKALRREVRGARPALVDPYPTLMAQVRAVRP